MYAISIQHMSKEFYGSHEQVTLAFLYMQLKVLELCKYLAQKLTVLFQGMRIDEHIIQVHQNITVQELKEDMIHHPLEVQRRVTQPHGHNLPLKRTILASETSFVLLIFSYRKLMIPITQVQFAKHASSIQTLKQLINAWQGKAINHHV